MIRKIDLKKLLLVILILGLGFIILNVVIANQNWYTAREIYSNNVVYLEGVSNEKLPFVEPNFEKNAIYDLPRVGYSINNEVDMTAYNAFIIENLKPLTEYEVLVNFNSTLNSEDTSSFDVGVINYVPAGAYTDETRTYSTNITTKVESDFGFTKLLAINGFYKYKAQIKFETNEDGMGWLIIGANSSTSNVLKYNIGQLKIYTTEIKNANTIQAE